MHEDKREDSPVLCLDEVVSDVRGPEISPKETKGTFTEPISVGAVREVGLLLIRV